MVLVEPALDDLEVAAVRAEEQVRDGADERDRAEQEVEADIAAHPRDVPFGHAEVARFPHHPGAHAGGDDVAGDRDHVEDHVEAHLPVEPRHHEQPLEQYLHRLDPPPHRLRVAAERELTRQRLDILTVHGGHASSFLVTAPGAAAPQPGGGRTGWAGSRSASAPPATSAPAPPAL